VKKDAPKDWMGGDLEGAADKACAAEAPVDWAAVGAATRTARDEAKRGGFSRARLDELLRGLVGKVPASRAEVLVELRRDLEDLLPK
jgi:hypothetical protein